MYTGFMVSIENALPFSVHWLKPFSAAVGQKSATVDLHGKASPFLEAE
jgi:hypothetical protein